MGRIVLDPGTKLKLSGLSETLELCDESGETLGHFLPEGEYRRLMYRIAEASCPFTKEELARRQKETGGRSLAEILRTLGAK